MIEEENKSNYSGFNSNFDDNHTKIKKPEFVFNKPENKPEFEFNKSEEKKDSPKKSAKRNTSIWKLGTIIFAVLAVVLLFTDYGFNGQTEMTLSEGEVASKTLSFVNSNLLQGQAVAKLTSIEEDDSGVYNVKLNINGQLIDGYATKDGKYFFPQAIDLEEDPIDGETTPSEPAPTPEVTKSDKPVVELFVMSHCPYGTQAEKGILPVVEQLGDKVEFELKFVNYAMHGEKEVLEQMNQVCIQEEQNEKFFDYLKCFLDSDNGEKCLVEAGIDKMQLGICVAVLDEKFSITEMLADQSTWSGGRFPVFPVHDAECKQYGIQGSPGLVINGQSVSSGRSPAEYLATLCAAFNDAPEECGADLSTQSYSPGFGYEVSDSATTASCG